MVDLHHGTDCILQATLLTPHVCNIVIDSTRLLFATWWIFIMILTAFYTANLTAFLTLSRFTLPIENVEDIAESNKQWFAAKGGPVEYAVMVGIKQYSKILKLPFSWIC